jgi:hypothetical protein
MLSPSALPHSLALPGNFQSCRFREGPVGRRDGLHPAHSEVYLEFVHSGDMAAPIRVAAQLANPGANPIAGFENRYRKRDGDYCTLEWDGSGS